MSPCEHGEVNADVFDMHRVGMYKEASYKPYAIAAMMFLQKVADPAATLKALDERATPPVGSRPKAGLR